MIIGDTNCRLFFSANFLLLNPRIKTYINATNLRSLIVNLTDKKIFISGLRKKNYKKDTNANKINILYLIDLDLKFKSTSDLLKNDIDLDVEENTEFYFVEPKNIDDYILRPLGESLFSWNMQFNKDTNKIKGDLVIKARGTSSLMQKYQNTSQTINSKE